MGSVLFPVVVPFTGMRPDPVTLGILEREVVYSRIARMYSLGPARNAARESELRHEYSNGRMLGHEGESMFGGARLARDDSGFIEVTPSGMELLNMTDTYMCNGDAVKSFIKEVYEEKRLRYKRNAKGRNRLVAEPGKKILLNRTFAAERELTGGIRCSPLPLSKREVQETTAKKRNDVIEHRQRTITPRGDEQKRKSNTISTTAAAATRDGHASVKHMPRSENSHGKSMRGRERVRNLLQKSPLAMTKAEAAGAATPPISNVPYAIRLIMPDTAEKLKLNFKTVHAHKLNYRRGSNET
jgi:hypothetical protein